MIELEQSPVLSDPDVMGGTLVFQGTCVKEQTLLDYIASGETVETFLSLFGMTWICLKFTPLGIWSGLESKTEN